jgi:hypothetical protein
MLYLNLEFYLSQINNQLNNLYSDLAYIFLVEQISISTHKVI